MKLKFIVIAGILLTSCSKDCSTCEQKLKDCTMNSAIPIKLPDTPTKKEKENLTINVGINEENQYLYQDSTYSLEEIVSIIDEFMQTIDSSWGILKISADKKTHFESVISLMSYAKEKEYKVILKTNEENPE